MPMFNSLPNNKILALTKLKAFADNKFNVASDGDENLVEKGENTGYQHFVLFPQYFQIFSLYGSLRVEIMCGKEINESH